MNFLILTPFKPRYTGAIFLGGGWAGVCVRAMRQRILGLAYAPVSQAHGHHHTQFNVLPCCIAAQTRSVPNVASRVPLQVAIESSLAV